MNKDDFDDFLTSCDPPNIDPMLEENDDDVSVNEMNYLTNIIPTTDTGLLPLHVCEDYETSGALKDLIITGNVLMNQCGTLLTRQLHDIRGGSRGKHILQKNYINNIW